MHFRPRSYPAITAFWALLAGLFFTYAVSGPTGISRAAQADATPERGAIVESVAEEGQKAGLKPGDSILVWRSGTAGGQIESPFELSDVETEYSTRAPVEFRGQRGELQQTWNVRPGTWGITVRSPLPQEILAVYHEARKLEESQKLMEAADGLRTAAGRAEASGGHSQAVWLLSEAVSLFGRARNWNETDEAAKMALERATPLNPYIRAQLLELWAHTFYRRDLGLAERYLTEALQGRRRLQTESIAVANLTNSLGFVARSRGILNRAEEYYREALAIGERLAPGGSAVATFLNNIGFVVWKRGELIRAEEYFRRSLALRQKIAPNTMYSSFNNLGAIALAEDDLAKAEEYWQQALQLRERAAPLSPEIVVILNNLGRVAEVREDFAAAERHFTRASELVGKLEPEGLDFAASIDRLGRLAWRRGNLDSAEEYHRRALAIRERLDAGGLSTAESFRNLGVVAETRGDLNKAEEFQRNALELREKLAPGSDGHADSLYRLALVLRAKGQIADTTNLLASATDILERSAAQLDGTEEERIDFRAQYAPYYRDFLDALLAQKQPERAFAVLERSRARSLLSMIAERDLILSGDLPADLKESRKLKNLAYDRVQNQINDLPSGETARRQSLLATLTGLALERDQIAERIRRASPRLAALQYPQPLNLEATRQALDPGTVLLAYSVGPEETALFVVRPVGSDPGISVFTLPVGEARLSAQTQEFRKAIESGGGAKRAALDDAARALYDALLKPVEEQLASADRLLIVPDGPLHTLPFAALERADKRFLVEWKPLHTVVSATVYAELKKMRGSTANARLELLAFGDPAIRKQQPRTATADSRAPGERGWTLGPLPFSREEVGGIAALFPVRRQVYLGVEATEERAKALMPEARLIHFAIHAVLNEQLPLDSALVLSVPERWVEGQENGLLQAWEILDGMRLNADLVVLSACQSGLGKESRGEGLIGLTRAFQYAGARSIVATLWRVDDRKTAELMARLYAHMQSGKSKDEALRAAQLELIHRNSSHPYYWAAFSLIGDWR